MKPDSNDSNLFIFNDIYWDQMKLILLFNSKTFLFIQLDL